MNCPPGPAKPCPECEDFGHRTSASIDGDWRLYYSVSTFGKNSRPLDSRQTRPSTATAPNIAGRTRPGRDLHAWPG